MLYFCTYFDRTFLSRGLALYRSLRTHAPAFHLWVLCMDTDAHAALAELNLPGITPIALAEFEQGDDALLATKLQRSIVEYYFTCTPSLPLYVLRHFPEVDLITYVDADLYFFSDLTPVLIELNGHSIAIIEHRFPPGREHLLSTGIYNVGWLSFRRDEHGLACLSWWRERCIEWCYDRHEDGRYGDQRYLDDWPQRFAHVVVIRHKGANVAPWNLARYRLSLQGGGVWVDEQPIVFFHFSGFRQLSHTLFDTGLRPHGIIPGRVLREHVYGPYLRLLLEIDEELARVLGDRPGMRTGRGIRRGTLLLRQWSRALRTISVAYRILFRRKYLLTT